MLLTLDEARASIANSGARLLARMPADTDPFVVAAALWGAGDVAGLTERCRRLARQHRVHLDAVVAAGYDWVAFEELDGLGSAVGLDEDTFDPSGVLLGRSRRSRR